MSIEAETKPSFREVFRSMNYNVKLVFAFSASSSLGRGIWMGNVLSLFVILMVEDLTFLGMENNELLGLTSVASGIFMTVFVFPAGILSDKYRRDLILKIASIMGIASLIILILSSSFSAKTNFILILVSLGLWGLLNAFVRPSLESIFADSVESGYRSRLYSWAHLVRQAAMALGPFINIGLFAIFGNVHNIPVYRRVMAIGIVISFVSIAVMLFFKDKRSLGKTSEAITDEVAITNGDSGLSRITKIDTNRASKLIPILLVTGNVIIGVGAGMTIKFFPVFFENNYNLKPIPIQAIMGATALATGLMGLASQKISLKLGRVQTIFLVQFIATACLLVLSIYPPLGVLVPIFIARGSFMNAAQPLSRSIVMDIVPKKNRGKWNSVEAIAWGLFWNASAFIGGFLVGDDRFALCFITTTFVYILGLVPIILLMPLVGKEREAMSDEELKELQENGEIREDEQESAFEAAEMSVEKEKVEVV
ncbi:MAG: MFS transporter [Asgard group archaeon]|nr:MFS transporter [Asgard group archaeon]